MIACPYPGPNVFIILLWQDQAQPLEQLPHPPSLQETGVPSGFFLPHNFISSSLAHLMPLLRISILFSISVSGNLPFFLKMMLKHSPRVQRATSTKAAKNISIPNVRNSQCLVDKACADCLVVVYLVDDVCKHLSHRQYSDLALVLCRVVAQRNCI